MAKERPLIFAVNAGEISALALGRVDLARMRLTCETYLNWIPRVIGPATFRPGLGYLSSTDNDDVARNIPFIFAANDTALIELNDELMKVRVNDALISRGTVATAVTNGNFSSTVGWTITTAGGGVGDINSTAVNMLAMRTPVRGGTVLVKREVTVAGGDVNDEHGLRIVVERGPVKFRAGSTDGGDEYIEETTLRTGTYSLALTPTGNFWVQFSCESETWILVDSITVEAAGAMELPTPWPNTILKEIRYDQSGDVIFLTHDDYQPKRIERRAVRSWGVAEYEFVDGPYRGKTANITLDPAVRLGQGNLVASAPFWKADHVGAIFNMFHPTTETVVSLSDDDRYTDTIRVSGVARYDTDNDGTGDPTNERRVTLTTTGTWVGTLSLLISYDEGASYTEFEAFTGNSAAEERHVGPDNSVVFVKVGFLPGNYTSGTVAVDLSYTGGGGTGVVRILSISSTTTAIMEVLTRLHSIDATKDWEEGKYSTLRGWPKSVQLFEGRLWFGDNDKINGSVSDDFESFDLDVEGDSGPIIRSVATGAVNKILSIMGLARLCMFTTGAEPVGRSSSFDEPITPTNFSIKDASTLGSADLQPVKIDRSAIYTQKSGSRAYVLKFDVEAQDYISDEITKYHEDILAAGVKAMAVQRQPDTRVWFVLDDGTVVGLVYQPTEDVISLFRVETDGEVEDVCVLPNLTADDVYFIVSRTSGRYVEKMAYDTNARGGVNNYMADSYVTTTLAAATVMSGLDHLEGQAVVAWVNGSPLLDSDGDPELFTVASGDITFTTSQTGLAIAGLPYTGDLMTSKLAYGAQMGTALSQPKKVSNFAPLLYKTHLSALEFGVNFDKMNKLPLVYGGIARARDYFLDLYDERPTVMPSGFSTDSRVCMRARAPMPATVQGISFMVETNERAGS